MESFSHLDDTQLRRRKSLVSALVAATVLVLFGAVLGGWKFLQDIESYLEDELGRRLLAIASLTAEVIDSGEFAYQIESGRLSLVGNEIADILVRVHEENQVQGVYLVNASYEVLAGSRMFYQVGDRLSFLQEDSVWVQDAWFGKSTVGPTHIVAGNSFKSAFAPVNGTLQDVVGMVVVQASADFFGLLINFQRGLIIGGLTSGFLAICLSMLLFWAMSRLIRAHESMRQNERLAAMGQMAATVAHEIRNPLGIIKGTADVLKSRFGGEEETDELLDFIPSEVRRLNRLVTDFLNFARDREIEIQTTSLQKSIEKSVTSLHNEMHDVAIEMKTEFEKIPDLPHDSDAINQIMLNLTLNAIQAIESNGKIIVRLKSLSKRGRRYARIEIEDNGCGFDMDGGKIFEPFYTTKTAGSGLGLAIIKRLVEKHGGWIEAESQKGLGTKIRFFLPFQS